MSSENAVCVRSAFKHYGPKNGPKRNDVLVNLNMTVRKGTIYGLLGSSGCGKTTLLNCIVDRQKLESGEILVFDHKPGTVESGVPGSRIGFMPQEVALMSHFTVREAVYFFARLCGMPEENINKRFRFLSNLLALPPENRYVKNCSGGQQRRISFAVALVHEPELLILDEPTVGLDPVLRDSMWEHLNKISSENNVAIVITTHYIEETKQAQKIGLMRNGTLLIEDNPNTLLSQFGTDTLEAVFLILSQKQSETESVRQIEAIEPRTNESQPDETEAQHSFLDLTKSVVKNRNTPTELTTNRDGKFRTKQNRFFSRSRFKSLLSKNFTQIARHPGGLLFCVLFPIADLFSLYWGVGGYPKDFSLAVVNFESNNTNCNNYLSKYPAALYNETTDTCDLKMLSCRFLNQIEDSFLKKQFYSDIDSALESVRKTKNLGALYFESNFTKSLDARLSDGQYSSEIDIENSFTNLWMDMTHSFIGQTIRNDIRNTYISFLRGVMKDCHRNPNYIDIPMKFHDPVYGKNNENFYIFLTPPIIITICFQMAATLTVLVLVDDRVDGLWERALVSGATPIEFLVSHGVVQFCLVLLETTVTLVVVFVINGVQSVGSYYTIIAICITLGVAGMAFGFAMSVFAPTGNAAYQYLAGSFFPILFLGGTVWPLEAMPLALQLFSKCLIFTVPILSLRNVMVRGWSITNIYVYDGFLIAAIWTVVLSSLTWWKLSRST